MCRVDYGHAEAAHKYGSDPRKYNVMSKKFVTDDQGHVRVRPVESDGCSQSCMINTACMKEL